MQCHEKKLNTGNRIWFFITIFNRRKNNEMKQDTSFRLNRNNRFTTIHCSKCDSLLKVQKGVYDRHLYCTSCYSYQGTLNEITGDCCTQPKMIFAKHINSDGRFQLRKICLNCNTKSSDSFPYKDCPNLNEIIIWDEQKWLQIKWFRNQERENLIFAIGDLFVRKNGICTDNKIDLPVYEKYLKSPEWKAKRKLVLERDKYKCLSCLSAEATEVHHITYRHLGNEPLFELVSICRRYHQEIYHMDNNYDFKMIVHDKLLGNLLSA